MSRKTELKPLVAADWDRSLQHIISDMAGRPLNIHGLMATHPALLKAWWDYRNYGVSGGDLSQRQCELVILRVGVEIRSWYEWASHVERGLAAGLSLEEIERVQTGPDHPDWAADDALLLRAVDECMANHQITGGTLSALMEYFTNRQIMDIIAIHGMYLTLGAMLKTWDLSLDEHVQLAEGVDQESWEQGLSK